MPDRARNLWMVWADLCGIVMIAAIAGLVTLGYALHDRHVSIHNNQHLLTPQITIGEQLVFDFAVNRMKATPGHIEDDFQRTTGLDREQVRIIRPLVTTKIDNYPYTKTHIDLPAGVTFGHWHFKSSLISDCLLWACEDVIIETDFDVIAP